MEQRVAAGRVVNRLLFVCVVSFATLLSACGGGGGSHHHKSSSGGGSVSASLSGGGVDGPMAKAVVKLYAMDASATGFRGALLGTGSTSDTAAIQGIDKPDASGAPYLLEFTSTADSRDLTACSDDNSDLVIDVAPRRFSRKRFSTSLPIRSSVAMSGPEIITSTGARIEERGVAPKSKTSTLFSPGIF